MYKGTTELAENKLLLLYMLNRVGMPMSNANFTQIVLENNLLNYFELQQYLSELVEAGMLNEKHEGNRHLLGITEKGVNSLELFLSRIPEKKKQVVDAYFLKNLDLIKHEVRVIAEYALDGNRPMVRLALKSDADTLIELKLPAENNALVQQLSQHWKDNYEELYDKILKLFKQPLDSSASAENPQNENC